MFYYKGICYDARSHERKNLSEEPYQTTKTLSQGSRCSFGIQTDCLPHTSQKDYYLSHLPQLTYSPYSFISLLIVILVSTVTNFEVYVWWTFFPLNHSSLLCRSQRPHGLRLRSAAFCVLRMWVRILLRERIFVRFVYCVLSCRGFCDELITRPEGSY